MNLLSKSSTALWKAVLLQAPLCATAVVGYGVAAGQPGNQAWTGPIGMDFQVNAPLTVLSLGAFDSNQDGIAGTIQVGIFFASGSNTGSLVPGLSLSFTGSGATLLAGSPFAHPGEPRDLSPRDHTNR